MPPPISSGALEREFGQTGRPAISASLQDRWTIVGTTGSGKTTYARVLVRELQRRYPAVRTYILDSKQGGDFSNWAGTVDSDEPPPPLAARGGQQVWQPPTDDREAYDVWLKQILKARKPAIVLIDELSSLGGSSGRSYPDGYTRLLKQGRGLDVCVVTLTQEAAYIPRQTLGQMTHLVVFRLQNDHDVRAMDRLLRRTKEEAGTDPPGRYGFLYRRVDHPGRAHSYGDYREFFGRQT